MRYAANKKVPGLSSTEHRFTYEWILCTLREEEEMAIKYSNNVHVYPLNQFQDLTFGWFYSFYPKRPVQWIRHEAEPRSDSLVAYTQDLRPGRDPVWVVGIDTRFTPQGICARGRGVGGGAFDFESLGVMRPGDLDRDRGPPTTLQGDPGLRLGCDWLGVEEGPCGYPARGFGTSENPTCVSSTHCNWSSDDLMV